VPQRSPFTVAGRAALIHAICHIEFNAINLALDAVWRFDAHATGLSTSTGCAWRPKRPSTSGCCATTCSRQGHDYGDFPAHQGLWDHVRERRSDDIVARMALVPRTMEARGLDATPQIQRKLRQVGTPDALAAVDILDTILRDEVGHVAIGNHWYRWLCARDGLDPVAHYSVLVQRHRAPRLRPPFNETARRQAGFSAQELDYLLGS
jgi:uncharacterized ferritin-like protein (DUF455 family)